MKLRLPICALIASLAAPSLAASNPVALRALSKDVINVVSTETYSNGVKVRTDDEGFLYVQGIAWNDKTSTIEMPAGTTITINDDTNEMIFRTPVIEDSFSFTKTDLYKGTYYTVYSSTGLAYSVYQARTGQTFISGHSADGSDINTIIETNDVTPYVVKIGNYEELYFPTGSNSEYLDDDITRYVIYATALTDEEYKEILAQLPATESDITDDEVTDDEVTEGEVTEAEDEEETASAPEVLLVEVKKPVVVYPTLAVHNVFRNNMVSVLNRIKPHQTVTSDQEFYVQSFKGSKASRIESTTSELNSRVYIESTSLYSNVKNKETLRQTGGTVGFDYENIGFCFSDLTGELNQYDLDSRLYSVYAGFGDQHKVVLSYGDHDLGNFDGDSYGALYEFNYNNFVADVAYTNTKFDQENLKTYMVGVGYTVAGNVVGPINGSIKGMVIQDFGDHKDQYGAKQGSTGILVSGMLQTNLTDNLGVYLMASGEVRRHASGASAALGVELAF